jgi:hypothetical protein
MWPASPQLEKIIYGNLEALRKTALFIAMG